MISLVTGERGQRRCAMVEFVCMGPRDKPGDDDGRYGATTMQVCFFALRILQADLAASAVMPSKRTRK